jgi:hypothetical protein
VFDFSYGFRPTLDALRATYRLYRSVTHPDKGGDQAAYIEVEKAYEDACRELGYE